jgi:phage terminase large subunit-like protein
MMLPTSASDTYPSWVFDASPIADPFGHGERAVRFLRALRHPKTGRPFQLDAWQERIVRRIYGPRHPDGTRVVRNVVMLVSRGARKTTLGAALALLHTVGPERVPAGQVVLAAYDRDQARIAFTEAQGLVNADRRIIAATKVLDYRHQITHKKSNATLRAVSSDAAAQNGMTPAFCLIDEVHAWKKRELYDILRTGLSKTAGTLSIVISQAGRGTETIADEVFGYARKVARGEVLDEGTLPILFETPADADWRDEDTWHRANPGLALGYPDLPSLRQMAREAENRPAMREKFRNDHLGIWLDGQADPWLDLATYDRGDEPLDLDERHGEPAWIGVDLGSTNDLTAVVLALRDADGGFTVVPYVFAPPQGSLRRRQERGEAPYSLWAEQGYLTATPGDVTDWDVVEAKIRELCELHQVEEVVMDPWGARSMMNRLADDGLPVAEHRQGFISMAAPMKAFERAVLAGKLRHGGHPVLRWCVGNVVIDTDPSGNLKANKSKAAEKIDAAVAAVMAVGRADLGEQTSSIYANTSARPEGLLVF